MVSSSNLAGRHRTIACGTVVSKRLSIKGIQTSGKRHGVAVQRSLDMDHDDKMMAVSIAL